MEMILFSVFSVLILIRIFSLPIRLSWKLLSHSACGFLCLWLLNATAPVTGIVFPINAATMLIAGFLGIPGIGFIALLRIM